MANEQEMKIGLFDPGMTHVHRVGLAGLYMTLKRLGKGEGEFGNLRCRLEKQSLTLTWEGSAKKAFDGLFRSAFGITRDKPDGLVDFSAHKGLGLGDLQRIELSRAVLGSFLQHNKQNNIPKGTASREMVLALGDNQVFVDYRPLVKPYAHADAAKSLENKKGALEKSVAVKGWLYPGAAERHSTLAGTEMQEPPEKFICLVFAPVGALYYRLSHKGLDGKFDKRRGTAVCFPHIRDLEQYSRCYERYLRSPVERLSADGLGDAGLSALVALRADESMRKLGITGCTVLTMGAVGWSKQQRTRTGVAVLEDVQEGVLDTFDLACACLKNRLVFKESQSKKTESQAQSKYFIGTRLTRGLIADNIATGKEWFQGFAQLMCSQQRAKAVSFDRGGLKEMVDKVKWEHEADKLFVQAVHAAIRNRYGALAAQAKNRGETVRFDREFERMRSGLMRAKNAQTLRAELADLFARGGVNKTLQAQWPQVLPLFTRPDWQRARDLALLGLASYAGKGAQEITPVDEESGEEEEI